MTSLGLRVLVISSSDRSYEGRHPGYDVRRKAPNFWGLLKPTDPV